jgi:glycosyltransferase involved in cell wall biosynthesis
MNLLFAYYTHKPGGFCKRLYRAMSACISAGHQVAYATLDMPPACPDGVRVILIPFPLSTRRGLLFWGLFTIWLPVYLLYLTALCRPDRLVPFGAYYAASMWPSGWLFGKPRILFLRSLTFKIDTLLKKPWLIRVCARTVDYIGIRSATCVVCMSEVMRRDVSSFSGRDMTGEPVLPNDVPTSVPSAAPDRNSEEVAEQGFVCATAGVLDARKNVSILLQAIALVNGRRGDRPPVRLIVFGEGEGRGTLEAQVRALALGEFVSFAGWVHEPLATLDSNVLLLHPALHEGVPNVVMEALARGLSVALSDVPEHRELASLCGGRNQEPVPLLHPQQAQAWAEFLERYRDLPGVRSQVAASSRVLASALRFDWDERLEAIIEGRAVSTAIR